MKKNMFKVGDIVTPRLEEDGNGGYKRLIGEHERVYIWQKRDLVIAEIQSDGRLLLADDEGYRLSSSYAAKHFDLVESHRNLKE